MREEVSGIAVGTALGTAQTFILREYADKKYPDKRVESLRGFGTPSAISGIVLGGLGVAAGATTGRAGPISYGVCSLVGGILSAIFPAIPV